MIRLTLDVDDFKPFNDKPSHSGGEEFAILLVSCSLPDAENFIERLLANFELIKVKTEQGQQVSTTLSVGATAIRPNERYEQAWKRAYKLLYQAKEQGRNRAVFD